MVKTTKQQRAAIHHKWLQSPQSITYRQFRRTAQPTFGMDDAIAVRWCGMWLAIETDGYTHS